MSKVLELLNDNTPVSARKYIVMFDCEMDGKTPLSCSVVPNDSMLEDYNRLANFVNGSQGTPELIFFIIDHFAYGMPEDEFEKLRWATREIQQKASRAFFPEPQLMAWGIGEGEKWVDRSLRVLNDPLFNKKMIDKTGNFRLKNIFVQANYQYIYHCTLDVLTFLND